MVGLCRPRAVIKRGLREATRWTLDGLRHHQLLRGGCEVKPTDRGAADGARGENPARQGEKSHRLTSIRRLLRLPGLRGRPDPLLSAGAPVDKRVSRAGVRRDSERLDKGEAGDN